MATKELPLRRADVCCECGATLPIGTRAQWDTARRTVRCLGCVGDNRGTNARASQYEPSLRKRAVDTLRRGALLVIFAIVAAVVLAFVYTRVVTSMIDDIRPPEPSTTTAPSVP